MKLTIKFLNCHDYCHELRCENCLYSGGEVHTTFGADRENGGISGWGGYHHNEGEECPNCKWLPPSLETS